MSVHSTSELSEGVSFKVRELDTAQSRIDDTLQRISIVVDRSNAVEGIRAALEVGDYETAAEHVSKYLELERRFGSMAEEIENRQLQDQRRVRLALSYNSPFRLHYACRCNVSSPVKYTSHDNVVMTLCGQLQVIEEAKVRLRQEIQTRLDEAKQKGDHKAVLRFTRLFAPLGLQASVERKP